MKIITKITIFSFIIALSCTNNDDSAVPIPPSFTPQTITFDLINWGQGIFRNASQNYSSGLTLVISNQMEWQSFEANFDPGNPMFDPQIVPIDFNTEQVIVVMNQFFTSSPSEATITSITEELNEIVVTVDYVNPVNGGSATPSHAYYIVKIPKQTKPFVFQ